MGKRANGEGTIYQRPDGRWRGRISLGKDASGKRIQKTVYGKTQQEVVDKLDELRQQTKLNKSAVIAKDSVAAYLQRWLETDVAVNRADRTLELYADSVRLYINPYIGAVKLLSLDGERLLKWQADLKKAGHTDNTRLKSIRVLRAALNKAVKLRMLTHNPCAVLDIPRVERREVIPLEPEQCHTLFAECESHRIGDVITLAAMTGLRKGELFALPWSAVNLREGVLTVRQTLQEIKGKLKLKITKTKSSRRVVTLEPLAIQALMNRLDKAKAEGFEPDEVELCFTDTQGGFLRNSNFDRNIWHPIRDNVGIPDVKFHDLRHTQASLMLHAGVDMKVIQQRLGHASYLTTANMYAHLMQDAQATASAKLATMMEAAKPSEVTG